MPLTPTIEVITERPCFAAGREQTADVLIRVMAPEPAAAAAARPRLNLSLVLDRSGSMRGEKLSRALEAARHCVDQLLPSDRVSVVTFDDEVAVLVPGREAGDKGEIRDLIAGIRAGGSTALHEAWVKGGVQVAGGRLDPAAVNRVLLITDGLANVGETRTETIVAQAGALAARGVSTSTIGIGRDFNEDLLIPMGEAGRGNSWHVAEPSDMDRIFAAEMGGLIAQAGHTVSLGLTPGEGVRVLDVLNDFEVTHTGRYKLPNLLAGSPIEVIARLRLPAGRSGDRFRALDLRLAWDPQEAGGGREVLLHEAVVEYAEAERAESAPADERVAKAVKLLTAARARREAMGHLDRGEVLAARRVVTGSLQSMADFALRVDDSEVREQVEMLGELEASLEAGADLNMARKKMSYQSHNLRRSRRLK